MASARRPDRPRLRLWLNTTAKLRARLFTDRAREEMTVTPEDTLRASAHRDQPDRSIMITRIGRW
jgi:hypothetical protein